MTRATKLIVAASVAAAAAPLAAMAACNSVTGVGEYTFEAGATTSTSTSTTSTTTSTTTGSGGGDAAAPGTCPDGDPEACGPVAGGTAACEGGVCVAVCSAGFTDCDGDFFTGCEVETARDPKNCGACARQCEATNVVALACSDGACTSTCTLGFANCSTPGAPAPDDGCETPANTTANCGSCGNACASGQSCNGSACVCSGASCGGLLSNCNGGRCVCGVGAPTCAPGEVCGSSGCACASAGKCQPGQTCCAGLSGCFDLMTNPKSCGACGRACAPGFLCKGGECTCEGAGPSACDAGGPGSCANGVCSCNDGAVTCAPGQRCLTDGSCG